MKDKESNSIDRVVINQAIDYIFNHIDEDITDEMVWDINREKTYMAEQRIALVTK